MSWIEMREVWKSYGRREAVRGVSLAIERGEILGLLGPNGAGKSTLVGMLSGFLSPSTGEILWEGRALATRLPAWRRALGMVLEDLSLFEFLTVEENIRFVARLAGIDDAESDRRCSELLAFLDMEDHAGTPAVEASQGTRVKLAFALAIVARPRILLLDEALNGIDALTASRLASLLRRLATAGASIVISSHALDTVQNLADRFVIIHRGKVVSDSPMTAIRASGQRLEDVYTSIVSEGRVLPGLTWAIS
jgi:ABC-type multidrug transport system ATPase subunit